MTIHSEDSTGPIGRDPDTADGVNSELRKLYSPVWDAAVAQWPRDCDLSAPLFIGVSPQFLAAKTRLLIVGKQTKLWPPRSDFAKWVTKSVRDLQRAYLEFSFGSDRSGAPFWAAAHQLREAANPASDRTSIVWSNVVKVDQDGDQPDSEFEAWIGAYKLLAHEVRILRPDAVVFFTGPGFDSRIGKHFPGFALHQLSDYSFRLEHPELPWRSFRCHHPNWLRQSRNWAEVELLCKCVAR